MTFGESIVFYRTKSGLTQRQLAEILGVTPTRLNYWEKDKRQPDVEMIKALASALHVSADVLIGNPIPLKSSFELSSAEIATIKKYRALDEHGKEMVDLVLEKEFDRLEALTDSDAGIETTAFRVSDQPAAAGYGVYLGPESFSTVMVRSDALPRHAAFGVPVSGDSMEPKYHDGDILIVSSEKPQRGEVGIYTMDGQGYVKVLGNGELISLNSAYAPIPMTEGIICNGKVIGVLSRDDIVEN